MTHGWILVDPSDHLGNHEAAMAFAEQHLGEINLTGVIFTHSHIDHFGGVLSLINAQQAADNNVPIIAPAGFMAESTSENIIAGPAMTRRGSLYVWQQPAALCRQAMWMLGWVSRLSMAAPRFLQPTLVIDQPEMSPECGWCRV